MEEDGRNLSDFRTNKITLSNDEVPKNGFDNIIEELHLLIDKYSKINNSKNEYMLVQYLKDCLDIFNVVLELPTKGGKGRQKLLVDKFTIYSSDFFTISAFKDWISEHLKLNVADIEEKMGCEIFFITVHSDFTYDINGKFIVGGV